MNILIRVKFKIWPKRFFYKFQRYYFPFMDRIFTQSSHPRALKTYFFLYIKATRIIVVYYVFCILSSSLIISLGTFDISEGKTITYNFTFKCKTVHSSDLKNILNFSYALENFCSFRFSLLYEKWIPAIFMVSLHKWYHFTLFSTSIPVILHFLWFGSNPEYFENVANVLRSSLIDLLSLKKKVVSSAYFEYN